MGGDALHEANVQRRRPLRKWVIATCSLVLCGFVGVAVVGHFHLLDRNQTTPIPVQTAISRYEHVAASSPTAVTSVPQDAASSTVPAATDPVAAVATDASSADAGTAPAITPSTAVTLATVAGGEILDPLPAPGVYVYTTTGHDSVDALNGDHHDYPASTTMTVTAAGCGIDIRWDVAVERWMQWRQCKDGMHISEPSLSNFDQFFGQPQLDAYDCSGESRPLDAAVGATWTFQCSENGALESYHGTVVGVEQRTVGSSSVGTLHVRVSIDDGDATDRQVTETWYLQGTDIVVAQTSASATSNSSPVGTVHYSEQYTIALTSLVPLR